MEEIRLDLNDKSNIRLVTNALVGGHVVLASLHHELLGVAGHGQHLPVLGVLSQLPQHLHLDMARGKRRWTRRWQRSGIRSYEGI